VEAINQELARLHEQPPTEREIQDAKSQLKGNMILAREDMENRMKRLFRQVHLTGTFVEYETSLELLQRIGRDDILSIIERRIHPDNFNLLAYGSRKLDKLPRQGYTF